MRRLRSIRHVCLFIVLCLGSAADPARGCPHGERAPSLLLTGSGCAGILDEDRVAFGSIEWRPSLRLGPLGTWLGCTASEAESFTGAGVFLDLHLTRRVVLTPSFGAGVFSDSDRFDLGHELEFRSGLDLGWVLGSAARIALNFSHVSNGRLGEENPGTETVSLLVAFPLRKRGASGRGK